MGWRVLGMKNVSERPAGHQRLVTLINFSVAHQSGRVPRVNIHLKEKHGPVERTDGPVCLTQT